MLCYTPLRAAGGAALCYDIAERNVQPLVKAPRPGAQQAASLAYDSGTSMGAWLAVAFNLRQYSSHSAGLLSHLRWRSQSRQNHVSQER